MKISTIAVLSTLCVTGGCGHRQPVLETTFYDFYNDYSAKQRARIVEQQRESKVQFELLDKKEKAKIDKDTREHDREMKLTVDKQLRELAAAMNREERLVTASLPSDVLECRFLKNLTIDITVKYVVMGDCLEARKLRREGR